jgi:signal transduction histidine kinase
MNHEPLPHSDGSNLHRRAEDRLLQQPDKCWREAAHARKMVNELQLNRLELEMQNAVLQATKAELMATLERFSLMHDFAPVACLTLNAAGVVMAINFTGTLLLGQQRQGIIGQPLSAYFLECHSFQSHLKEVLQTTDNVITTLQLRDIDGERRYVQLVSRVIKYTENTVGDIDTIMTDISKSKALEWQMQLRADMEVKLRQQVATQTAAAIAHELSQPLTALSMNNEVALRYLNSNIDLSDQLRSILEDSLEQTHRAGQSLHELLGFLQKGDFVVEQFDINSLIRDVISTLMPLSFRGFSVILDLEAELPRVLGDRNHVQKVLVNLLRNSGEALLVAHRRTGADAVTVRTRTQGELALVTVQDSGSGLDAVTAKRVFEPFFSTKPKGNGLGLTISRSLIEANGGHLWLDIGTQLGTTFHFTLPFALEAL